LAFAVFAGPYDTWWEARSITASGEARELPSVGAGGGRRARRQLDDQCRQTRIASDAANVAATALLTPPLAAPTLRLMGVLMLPPLGQPPIDEYLDLRISQELSLQIRVDVGMTPGHDEQKTRHEEL
jgi:hypothetical protein